VSEQIAHKEDIVHLGIAQRACRPAREMVWANHSLRIGNDEAAPVSQRGKAGATFLFKRLTSMTMEADNERL
jgi:hypothetical protein